MTPTPHTPGPWTAHWYEKNKRTHTGEWYWTAPDPNYPEGHSINVWMGDKNGESEANARLVAAAPELLEALKQAPCSCVPSTICARCTAILKAKGRIDFRRVAESAGPES